jgi:predicted amidohydrolase
MTQEVTIALAQIASRVADKEYNIKVMEKKIKEASQKNADLIVFPELALTGYLCRDLVYELAEALPEGPSFRRIAKIAKLENMHVVFGMIEHSKKASAVIYNTAVLVDPSGFVGKYHKMHLPTHSVFEEKRYFRQGYENPVFKTNLGKIGMIICYDVYFPELTRILKLKGAQLIVCISASPSTRRGFFEALTVARAIENTVFLAFTNLVGIEDGLQFWGGSRIVAPSGNVITQAKYDKEDLILAKINYADMKRIEAFVPTLRDLRPELFDEMKREAQDL